MAKKVTGYIKLQIPAGKATPAPPVGPALGQHGVNIVQFTKEFNARTADQGDLIIPVVITVYADRSFSFITKTPPAAVLLKKAAKIKSGSGVPNKTKVAKVTKAQVQEIAELKMKDLNGTGNDLAAANTYGYGRLAMNPSEDSAVIAKEWAELTLPKSLSDGVVSMLMKSWSTYEKYTSPLGIGWMVTPHYHYGPDIDGYEYDRWGTYHRADRNGLGVDRTPNGTGYTTQYNEPWCTKYADKKQCPQELLLFFHYVRYDEVLSSGKTLIQHIYDTHFEGVNEVEEMIAGWKAWKEEMAEDVYERVLSRMERQLSNAIEWRDRVNTYFYRKSGVKDALSRKIYE